MSEDDQGNDDPDLSELLFEDAERPEKEFNVHSYSVKLQL